MAAPQNSERALCADAWQHGAWRVCVSQGRCEIPHTSQGGPFMIPPYSGVQAAGTRVVSDWRQESNHDKASGVPVGLGAGGRGSGVGRGTGHAAPCGVYTRIGHR